MRSAIKTFSRISKSCRFWYYKNTKMEVNKTINLLKNSLLTLEKDLPYPLSKLTGTNVDYKKHSSTAISVMKPFFEGKDTTELRSLHLLLLVNTELNISDDLELDHNIGHVVGFIPLLSRYFYLISVVELNLLKFLKEVVEHAPVSLVLEIINLASKESKYLSLYNACQVDEKILNAITTRIKFSDCDYVNRKLFEHFQSLMLHFKNEERDEDVKVDEEMLRTVGYKILSLLKIIHNLLKLSFNLTSQPEAIYLYNLSLTTDVQRWYHTYDLIDKSEILKKSLEIAFFKCRLFLYDLDVQMYMEWHETEYEGSTLQTIIGEESYYVCQLLKSNKNSECLPKEIFELIEMLSGIICEPKVKVEQNFQEKLSVERLEELILEKEIDLSLFNAIKCFLKDEDNRFEFVVTIKLIHKLCSENRTKEIPPESVKETVLSLLGKSELDELASFISDFLNEYGVKSILFQQTVDLSEIIKNINECNAEEDDVKNEELTIKKKNETLKDAVLLAFQSPEFILSTLVEQSILESNHQKGILEVFKTLKSLCLFSPNLNESPDSRPLLMNVIENFFRCNYAKLSPSEKQLLTDLVLALSSNSLIDNDQFLAHCLLPLLDLKDDINWEITTDLLKLFKEFYKTCVQDSKLSTVIIMIQLAQLLERSRWSIDTFAPERLNACEEVISLIELFLEVYTKNPGPEKDAHWLSIQLRRFSYLTKSYFPYIYGESESGGVDSLFLSLIHKPSDVHTEFVKIDTSDSTALMMAISKLIISLTPKELQNIVSNYAVGNHQRIFFILNVLSDAVAFVCGAATQFAALQSVDNNPIFSCLGHVINIYLNVLQINISNCRSSDDQTNYIKCINRIAVALKTFPKHLIRTYQFNVIKIINEILPALEENSNDFDGDTRQLLLGLLVL